MRSALNFDRDECSVVLLKSKRNYSQGWCFREFHSLAHCAAPLTSTQYSYDPKVLASIWCIEWSWWKQTTTLDQPSYEGSDPPASVLSTIHCAWWQIPCLHRRSLCQRHQIVSGHSLIGGGLSPYLFCQTVPKHLRACMFVNDHLSSRRGLLGCLLGSHLILRSIWTLPRPDHSSMVGVDGQGSCLHETVILQVVSHR